MSKYIKLSEYLAGLDVNLWETSFDKLEKLLGFELPTSAYKYQAWWANQAGSGHSQTHGWKSVGWRTEDLDISKQRVSFVRADQRKSSLIAETVPEMSRSLTIGQAKAGLAAHFGVQPEMIEIIIKG